MNILLTNDDGIDAPGLVALSQAIECLGATAVVVAPLLPHSGCGHRVTTDRPLRVVCLGPNRYCVDGTPADCVRIGLAEIAAATECVVSGINAGGNLGVDVHHSGTVAAAREAALHGRHALAVSQYHGHQTAIDWQRSVVWLKRVLLEFPLSKQLPGEFWNLNFPALPVGDFPSDQPAIINCAIDASPCELVYLSTENGWQYASPYHKRPRTAGCDVDICFKGGIALSRGRVV